MGVRGRSIDPLFRCLPIRSFFLLDVIVGPSEKAASTNFPLCGYLNFAPLSYLGVVFTMNFSDVLRKIWMLIYLQSVGSWALWRCPPINI